MLIKVFDTFFNTLPSGFIASIGAHNRNKKEQWVQYRTGTKLIFHQNWNKQKIWNDIALIKLNQNVTFNDIILPACMESKFQNSNISRRIVWTTGWGYITTQNQKTPEKKHELELIIQNTSVCAKIALYNFNTTSQLCGFRRKTSVLGGDGGVCGGDSGGPLVYEHSDKQWYVVGIVSYIAGPCGSNSFFTKVSNYKTWITDNMK